MSENKIATKADLQRMYNKMLPYLGGMPEMVANKFSKGDLYSTDERMIGQWIDGKPLYQKVYNIEAITLASESWNETSIDGTNMNEIIYVRGYDSNPPVTLFEYLGAWINPSTKKVNIYNARNNGTPVLRRVILQYTKTTDSPISIGSDTDYSIEEKIVGTWIDGKPLYQKTIDCGVLPNNTTKSVNTNILNASKLINYSATAFGTNNNGIMAIPRLWLDGNGNVYIGFSADLTVINFATTSDRSNMNAYCTLQYTKTTD